MLTGRTAAILGIVGAIAGAALGFWSVGVLGRQGFHAIVLPAGLPGIVGGAIARQRSVTWSIVYGAVGLAAALITEWRYRPFIADQSFGYFVRHVGDVTPIVLGVIVIGAIVGGMFAFSAGRGRS